MLAEVMVDGRGISKLESYDALIGLPERRPDALLADKGYDADAIRADIPGAENRGRDPRQIKPLREDRTRPGALRTASRP
jgi:hypothetical protein